MTQTCCSEHSLQTWHASIFFFFSAKSVLVILMFTMHKIPPIQLFPFFFCLFSPLLSSPFTFYLFLLVPLTKQTTPTCYSLSFLQPLTQHTTLLHVHQINSYFSQFRPALIQKDLHLSFCPPGTEGSFLRLSRNWEAGLLVCLHGLIFSSMKHRPMAALFVVVQPGIQAQ